MTNNRKGIKMILISPYSVFEHIFEVDAIVNTINTKGYMGKGLALECALRFPDMEKKYKKECQKQKIKAGDVWIYEVESEYWEDPEKEIRKTKRLKVLNAATKDDYKFPSKIEWVESVVNEIKNLLNGNEINSITLPKLGAGLGKLNWENVEDIIVTKLSELDKKIIIALDLIPGEREKLGIRRAMKELFSKKTLFENNTEHSYKENISRFRELLNIENVGKKKYSELVRKYY
ncbi:macro domain-containing protein [Fervidobacterium gondwanense]|uniref:macro domain-containing protein n=1 Tax=Fervidobacterium gondwanense TaxID=44754 RepID=UPI003C727889